MPTLTSQRCTLPRSLRAPLRFMSLAVTLASCSSPSASEMRNAAATGAGAAASGSGASGAAGGSGKSGGFGNSDAAVPDPSDASQAAADGGTSVARSHVACDETLALASLAADDGARAIGLCPGAPEHDTGAGLVAAAYTDAVGQAKAPAALQIGLVDRFGPVEPREGKRMLLLSSGVARAADQAGYTSSCDGFDGAAAAPAAAPPGFPKQAPRCALASGEDVAKTIYNPAALSLELAVPSGATALSVDFNFYTPEFPGYVCGAYNDFFVILMDPPPAGADDGNIAFDVLGNPISVNSSLLRACDPSTQTSLPFPFPCELGTAPLDGTGFDLGDCLSTNEPGGSTGWLSTTVPVTAGTTIRLRFAIWDTGDLALDSSVLVDNFRFVGDAVVPPSKPITQPAPPD